MADGADQKYWADGQPLEFLSSPDDTTGGEQKFWVDGQPFALLVAPSGAYTITADTRSYTLTGIDAGLVKTAAATLLADTASYALTGIDTGLLYGRIIVADTRSYVFTGVDATLAYGIRLSVDTGTFTVTANDAQFNNTHILVADAAGYAVSGIDAVLAFGEILVADTQTYAVTGTDVEITAPPYYSAEGLAALPSNRNALAYLYNNADRAKVAADDGQVVSIKGAVAVHQFQLTAGSSTILQVRWKGYSSLPTTVFPITLEIWNANTNAWETGATNNNTAANNYVELNFQKGVSTPNYIDANNRITARVWQGGIA